MVLVCDFRSFTPRAFYRKLDRPCLANLGKSELKFS